MALKEHQQKKVRGVWTPSGVFGDFQCSPAKIIFSAIPAISNTVIYVETFGKLP